MSDVAAEPKYTPNGLEWRLLEAFASKSPFAWREDTGLAIDQLIKRGLLTNSCHPEITGTGKVALIRRHATPAAAEKALAFLIRSGCRQAVSAKQWQLDQVVQILTGNAYPHWLSFTDYWAQGSAPDEWAENDATGSGLDD